MGQKKFTLNANNQVEKCPKCGNNTEFVAHSNQFAEDCCEVWVVCSCGYEPTAELGHRLEDVWGSLDEDTIRMALQCWNDEIESNRGKEIANKVE